LSSCCSATAQGPQVVEVKSSLNAFLLAPTRRDDITKKKNTDFLNISLPLNSYLNDDAILENYIGSFYHLFKH